MVSAIIVAAGKSERMGSGVDKAFLSLGPKPVIAWSLLAFERCPDVDQIVLVVRKDQLVAAKALAHMFGISKLRDVVAGGGRRQESVANGLKAVDPDTRIAVVHDGARPCVRGELIADVIKAARRSGAAVPGHRVWDTVKVVEKGSTVSATEDRSRLWVVQTPQAFDAAKLRAAYAAVAEKGAEVTDDAQAMELAGEAVRIVESTRPNPKITTPDDLSTAAAVMGL